MLSQRGIHGVRAIMGLVSLAKHHPVRTIDQACRVAHGHGAHRLRDIRNLLKRSSSSSSSSSSLPLEQEQFEFASEHPLIRSLADYSQLIHVAFEETRS